MNAEDYGKKLDDAQHKLRKQHCADCGGVNAHVPMACVMNMTTAKLDTYQLQLPPLCNACAEARGFTRRGLLAPKTSEIQNATEILTGLMEKIPDWSKRALENSVQELIEQGMDEAEARDFVGLLK